MRRATTTKTFTIQGGAALQRVARTHEVALATRAALDKVLLPTCQRQLVQCMYEALESHPKLGQPLALLPTTGELALLTLFLMATATRTSSPEVFLRRQPSLQACQPVMYLLAFCKAPACRKWRLALIASLVTIAGNWQPRKPCLALLVQTRYFFRRCTRHRRPPACRLSAEPLARAAAPRSVGGKAKLRRPRALPPYHISQPPVAPQRRTPR